MQQLDSQTTTQNPIPPQAPIPSQPVAPQTPPSDTPTPTKIPHKKLLIIVITIIILVILVVVGLYFYKQRGVSERDSKRKSDIERISAGLEKYRQDTLNAQYYPSAITANTLEKRGYLDKFPTDPKNTSPYTYSYQGLPEGCPATGTCTGYTLTACLENKKDKGENTTDPIAPCTTRSYQVTNPS